MASTYANGLATVILRCNQCQRNLSFPRYCPHSRPGCLASAETLGVIWTACEDVFSFKYPPPEEPEFTHRGVLRQLTKIFDPSGHLQPFTIRSHELFQEACIRGKGWDELLGPDHCRRWEKWFGEFNDLAQINVERSFRSRGAVSPLTLHTFVDASGAAYASLLRP